MFVCSQLILKLVIIPIQEFKRTIADISLALVEHAHIFSNPNGEYTQKEKDVSEIIRNLSSKLNAQLYLIPYYTLNSVVFKLPPMRSVFEASKHLIGLSNGFNRKISDGFRNIDKANKVRENLNIYKPD